ncbi:MAG: hypothetical protein JSU70_13420 [Phycisphaerales bacterium]|nr:MAG: hypothetical protein JSU70_13420 [Phycisphaerales bacterium]
MMYDKRVKIFVALSAIPLLLCILRLIQMQLLPAPSLKDDIDKLIRQRSLSRQLRTVRGRILDRNDQVLAVDEARLQLSMSYQQPVTETPLCGVADERVRKARLLRAARMDDADVALPKAQEELQKQLERLEQIIAKCTRLGTERAEIEGKIRDLNDRIWNLRTFQAWRQNCSESDLYRKHEGNLFGVRTSDFVEDFEKHIGDEEQRLILISKVRIREMYMDWPLLELRTDDEIFAAQLEFMDIDEVKIFPESRRYYPYGSAAAQTIGWVGPATQKQDRELFADDRFARYLDGEVCGREDGVEYVCEAVLRGKRGELVHNIDRELTNRTEAQLGKDVWLTLDIKLQKRIEDLLASKVLNPNHYRSPTAAVVIDVTTGDILAMVSMPVFDLNRARYDYDKLSDDANEPLRNRAINEQYPPGSVVKPVILIAGLESGEITPDQIISCPAQAAPVGWPNCLIFTRHGGGHDNSWQNHARNAIKGSCNIYFSRLAERIDTSTLQNWLFKFGYGRQIHLSGMPGSGATGPAGSDQAFRDLREAPGLISTIRPETEVTSFEQVPPLKAAERRLFGIGHGNMRATPLQVANSFATIARGGVVKKPRLFLPAKPPTPGRDQMRAENRGASIEADLKIAPEILASVYEGMRAVVAEPGGTAYQVFVSRGLAQQGLTVYGKTGSTERPETAWFAGFAADSAGRKLAVAVIVEGGQYGSSDAGPLARDILQYCIEAGHIGQAEPPT